MTVHIYWSGPGGSALPPHTDRAGVLVAQLAGVKHWTTCVPPLAADDAAIAAAAAAALVDADACALHALRASSAAVAGCALHSPHDLSKMRCVERTLRPGDVLYMPQAGSTTDDDGDRRAPSSNDARHAGNSRTGSTAPVWLAGAWWRAPGSVA